MSIRLHALLFITTTALVLTGCASRGSRSPNAHPVLYPNGTYKQIGEAQAQEELRLCIAAAVDAGLTPDERDNAAGRGAARGAAVIGTAATVGALVRGRSVEGAVASGARGAVVGGSVGAVSGAMSEKPNMTYRHFVQRCASEKGLEVIGWQ